MAYQKKHEYIQPGEFTERQWFMKGFLLNDNAKGEERYTNSTHQKTAIYYNSDQVHEGGEELKRIKKERAHEAYIKRKEEEKQWKHAQEVRDSMNTEYQWLFEIGRIPNNDAIWRCGEDMNRTYKTTSYGSRSYYCHERETHEPKDETELKVARWRSDYRYTHQGEKSPLTDEEIIELMKK